MPRKKIPYKDKAIIKKRLAQGLSLRKAIKGTSVKSSSTAIKIREENSSNIERIKKDYLELIEGFGASEIDRAELWAKMTKATSDQKKKIPDWKNRKEALKYIDSLRGIDKEEKAIQQTQVNIFTRLRKDDDEFIEGEVE